MDKAKDAAKGVVNESNPIGFLRRLRGMPVIKQVLRVLDRFI